MTREAKAEIIDVNLKSTVYLFSFTGLIPFIYFALTAWVPSLHLFELDPVSLFRIYSAIILSFLAGTLWSFGLIAGLIQKQVEIRSRSLIWAGIVLSLLAWGNLFISAQAALFVAAMLFLTVWQVEQKTELSRYYPMWYANMRARLSMIVAMAHIVIWLTIS